MKRIGICLAFQFLVGTEAFSQHKLEYLGMEVAFEKRGELAGLKVMGREVLLVQVDDGRYRSEANDPVEAVVDASGDRPEITFLEVWDEDVLQFLGNGPCRDLEQSRDRHVEKMASLKQLLDGLDVVFQLDAVDYFVREEGSGSCHLGRTKNIPALTIFADSARRRVLQSVLRSKILGISVSYAKGSRS